MSNLCPDVVGKAVWPELVGVAGGIAAATVERENPAVHAVIVRPGDPLTRDINCERVRVFVGSRGIVTTVPVVG